MVIYDIFPRKMTLIGLISLTGILVLFFITNSQSKKRLNAFYQQDVPAYQVYCGALRLINENQQLEKSIPLTTPRMKINQEAILYSLNDLAQISRSSILSKESVNKFRKNVENKNTIVPAGELSVLETDMQDFIENYLTKKKNELNKSIQQVTMISIVGVLGFIFFIILLINIYRIYRSNLLKLSTTTSALEEQHLISINNSKLVSLGDMAAGLSHEINNPLAVILGRIEILFPRVVSGVANKEDVLKVLSKITEMSKRIAGITTSMNKVYSKRQSVSCELIKVSDVLETILKLFSQQFEAAFIEIKKTGKCDLEVMGNYNDVAQILTSLLTNSYEELQNLKGPRRITIDCDSDEKFGLIHISDSGKGISAEIRERIFDPFFTTKDVGMGVGLGLSVSYNLAHLMRGDLALTSENEPTTFTLKLPLE